MGVGGGAASSGGLEEVKGSTGGLRPLVYHLAEFSACGVGCSPQWVWAWPGVTSSRVGRHRPMSWAAR